MKRAQGDGPKEGGEVINWYSRVDKKYLVKPNNPAYHVHHINIPFRMVIAGGSGSGKTNTLINVVIHNMPATWHRIVICTKQPDEPLYAWLKEKLPSIEIHSRLDEMPDLDSFDKELNNLVVLDDMCMEKDQRNVEQLSIRGRKRGCSLVFLTQSWYHVPPVLRKNLNYIILKKIAKQDELVRLLRDYSVGLSREELVAAYKKAIKPDNPDDPNDKSNFFMLCLDEDVDSPWKIRRNFTPLSLTA